jgi:phosphohistidine phosphatase
MRVTLIRHAEAGDDAPRDEARTLTLRGRADAWRVGRALAARGVQFSLMVSSPLVRALQTAEIVAAAVEHPGRVLASDLILPEASAARVVAFLRSLADQRSVALVAHEPILSAVAAALTQEPRHPALRKGEALRISIDWGGGKPERDGESKRKNEGKGGAKGKGKGKGKGKHRVHTADKGETKAAAEAKAAGVLRWRIDPSTGRRERL